MKTRRTTFKMLAATTLGVVCLASTQVLAAFHICTLPASVGTVDENDRDEVKFTANRATILNSLNNAKATIRYDIQMNHEQDVVLCDRVSLYVRFKDNGANARVITKLKQYNTYYGTTSTVLTLDSDDFDASDTSQLQWVVIDGDGVFELHPQLAYFVEVTLIKRGSAGRPELSSIYVHAQEQ